LAAAREVVAALEREELQIAGQLAQDFPESVTALGILGMVHNRQGKAAKALECWTEGLRRSPLRGDFYDAMATVALRKGEYAKAAELCRQGLEKAPGTSGLHGHLAEALTGLGRVKEAIGEFEREATLSPTDATVRFLLGQSYALLNQHDKARGCYQTAIKLQPDDPRFYYGLATACTRLGLEEEAQRQMQEFEQRNAASMERQRSRRGLAHAADSTRVSLARTCSDAGLLYFHGAKLDRAEDLYRRGAEVNPQDTACRIQLGILFLRTNRPSSAIGICKELIAIEPGNAEHYRQLGMIYARLRQFDAARAQAKRAVELAPDDEQCRELYRQLGGAK
jgi:tetratricopeptide (TPR) repeat protein